MTHVSSETSVYHNEAGRRCHLCPYWQLSVWSKIEVPTKERGLEAMPGSVLEGSR